MATTENTEKRALSRVRELRRTGEQGDYGDLQERSRRATRQLLRWLPWAILNLVVVGTSIVVGSIALTGTAVTLAIFSPILVPAGIVLCLIVGGGLATVAVGVAIAAVCYRLYTYIKSSRGTTENPTKQQDLPAQYKQQVLAASGA